MRKDLREELIQLEDNIKVLITQFEIENNVVVGDMFYQRGFDEYDNVKRDVAVMIASHDF